MQWNPNWLLEKLLKINSEMDSLQSRRRRFSNSSQVVEDSSAFLEECWSGMLTSKIDHGL